jgi:hypothetical protein
MKICFPSLLFFLYPSFLSVSCVLSWFCLVFGFCRFLNNPFTLFLRYSVDYIWSTMEQWRQYLCRFLYTYDYSSITQTHINYRIYKPKARLVNWELFFFLQNHWLGMCYNFFVILTRARLVLLLPHFVWLNQLKYGMFWEYINNSKYT